MIFEGASCGLCKYNAANLTSCSKPFFLDYSFLQTVENNKLMHSVKDARRIEETRVLRGKIGRPEQVKLCNTLDAGLILNCPFTSRNAKRAEDIFGKEVAIVRGREIRDPQRATPRYERRDHLASGMKERNIKVNLSADIFM